MEAERTLELQASSDNSTMTTERQVETPQQGKRKCNESTPVQKSEERIARLEEAVKQIKGILSQKETEQEEGGEAVMVSSEERISWMEQSLDSMLHRLTTTSKEKGTLVKAQRKRRKESTVYRGKRREGSQLLVL